MALFFIVIKKTTVLGALKKVAHFLFYWNIITTGLAMVMFSVLSFGDVYIGHHTLMYGRVLGYTGITAVILYAILSMIGILGAYLLHAGIQVSGTGGHYAVDKVSVGMFAVILSIILLFP